MPKSYELMELIRQKKSMAAQISKLDGDYASYAGGSLEISSKIAMIDFLIEEDLLGESFNPLLKLYRSYLFKQRKAFFATAGSTEITKLGFIQGDPTKYKDALEEI